MNSRFPLIALSIAMAVLSMALVITVVAGTASSISGETIAIDVDEVTIGKANNHLFAYQRSDISQFEPLTLTEPISIYLPLVSTAGYIDKTVERAALIALYNSTNGDEWINNTGWGTEASFCEWYGVTCDENGHVTVLDLEQNMISGTLPSEIGTLQKLTKLRLTGTSITMWCNATKSAPPPCYYIEYYQLSDPLPPEIGNLANLQELDLSYNRLASLPPEIGNLPNLQHLDLSDIQLTYLPPEIGTLVSLKKILLYHNQLVSLPSGIGNLANLQELDLSYNQLASLPPDIGKLASLKVLLIEYNQLTSLPAEIGSLASLQHLSLEYNQLTSLPPEIGNLASLQWLFLYDNQLSGPIPAFFSKLSNLYGLYLSNNPDLTCWETEEARDWALSLDDYYGPTCFFP